MRPDRLSRPARLVRPLALVAMALGLSACATPPVAPALPPTATPAPPDASTAAACGAALAVAGNLSVPSLVSPPATATGAGARPACGSGVAIDPADAWAVKFLLGYAERLQSLSTAELANEITSLGEPGQQPMGQMQLALALSKSPQPVDTARALGLLQRVIAQSETTAAPYKPLARLLATRLMDRRRLEETVDRQNQQLREQQRRIEQLSERLEAMRAIERSLPRPGSAPGLRSPRPALIP